MYILWGRKHANREKTILSAALGSDSCLLHSLWQGGLDGKTTLEDGTVITHQYNKNGIHISETAQMPDGSSAKQFYDADGNGIREIFYGYCWVCT